jgi:hypothetical protein
LPCRLPGDATSPGFPIPLEGPTVCRRCSTRSPVGPRRRNAASECERNSSASGALCRRRRRHRSGSFEPLQD